MQRNSERNMQEIFQTIHGKDRKTMDKMYIPSTLAPQKSLIEMVNGV